MSTPSHARCHREELGGESTCEASPPSSSFKLFSSRPSPGQPHCMLKPLHFTSIALLAASRALVRPAAFALHPVHRLTPVIGYSTTLPRRSSTSTSSCTLRAEALGDDAEVARLPLRCSYSSAPSVRNCKKQLEHSSNSSPTDLSYAQASEEAGAAIVLDESGRWLAGEALRWRRTSRAHRALCGEERSFCRRLRLTPARRASEVQPGNSIAEILRTSRGRPSRSTIGRWQGAAATVEAPGSN